ncbi:MAG: SprT-like domain-containing protein [Cyclobacteriaceae bacterium]
MVDQPISTLAQGSRTRNKTIEFLAKSLMDQHGVTALGYTFRWNNRKSSLGVCKYGSKQIQLSAFFVNYLSIEELTDTILHEIAHALCPGEGHSLIWLTKAKEIGCKSTRCFDVSENHPAFQALKNAATYKAVCVNGHEHFLSRKPTSTKSKSCGLCARSYDERYKLEYFKVEIG